MEKIKTCSMFPKLFFNKPPIYETTWKNIVEPAGLRWQYVAWGLHCGYLGLHVHIQNM